MKKLLPLFAVFALLAACGGTAVPPTTAPTAAEPTAAVAEPAAVVEMGQTEMGAFYRGSPSAPVQLYDYSNFL